MAQNVRQNTLFAAEDYTAIYESYINANFQAYDYDTIREAMVDYVKSNYPENYNDWIESSEFVSILDLIAQFGHSLAYRVDMNTRNNYLSTAQRQDAVFKLSNFLGYQPRRNLTATGLMKISSIKTNEPVIGSEGTSLGGKEIRYESTSSIDNLDDFNTAINAVFAKSSKFGSPSKQAIIDGIVHQFYNLNNIGNQVYFDINGIANGSGAIFNIHGTTYDVKSKSITETTPNPANAFSLIYKNDGRGITSSNVGFFVGLKQGTMQYKDVAITNTIASQGIDIDVNNINDKDVWVQTIDDNGSVLVQWTKVDSVTGSNEIYNSIDGGTRDIFSVVTRADNKISVKFPDNRFGNVPTGTIRVWYRQSLNMSYVLRPDDITGAKVTIKYTGADGNTYQATFGLELKSSITTASASETIDEVKQNAPRVYATQDRMITADDYSSYLYSQSGTIKKIKSINRTHSGHSRYVNFNDPTGAYTNLNIMATDGTLSSEDRVKLSSVNLRSSSRIFAEYVAPILDDTELVNLYYTKYKTYFDNIKDTEYTSSGDTFIWQNSDNSIKDIATGFMIEEQNTNTVIRVANGQTNYLKYMKLGALVQFRTPAPESKTIWAKVSRVFANGLGIDDNSGNPTGLTAIGQGAIALDTYVPNNSELLIILNSFSRQFTTRDREIINAFLDSKQDFAIRYDVANSVWNVDNSITIEDPSDVDLINDDFDQTFSSWMVYLKFKNSRWDIYYRTTRYTLASAGEIQFSNINNQYKLSEETKKKNRDSVKVFSSVTQEFENFYVYGYEKDANGADNPSTVILSLIDGNSDNRPDDPYAFDNATEDGDTDIRFEWKHIPAINEIVDPGFTNIIDVFLLTADYDTQYRNWLTDSTGTVVQPIPSTLSELNRQFTDVENKKAMSDKIVYRPVKYKTIFGNKSDESLKCKFRVIKVPGINKTDNEIKNKIVESINEFFEVSKWDFGETFYFTELAAYVHKQLVGVISSFVIVPTDSKSTFGALFQITPASDELFIPDVNLNDIDIIDELTQENIRYEG